MTFTEVLTGNQEDLVDINQEKSDRALAAAKKNLTICLEFSGKKPRGGPVPAGKLAWTRKKCEKSKSKWPKSISEKIHKSVLEKSPTPAGAFFSQSGTQTTTKLWFCCCRS